MTKPCVIGAVILLLAAYALYTANPLLRHEWRLLASENAYPPECVEGVFSKVRV